MNRQPAVLELDAPEPPAGQPEAGPDARPPVTARSITQVFMSPEVRAMANDGQFDLLASEQTACGIVVYIKRG